MEYDELIRKASFLVSGTSGENPEYERGMAELIMVITQQNGEDVETILKDIQRRACS